MTTRARNSSGLFGPLVLEAQQQSNLAEHNVTRFETFEDCRARQEKMLRRFDRRGITGPELAELRRCNANAICAQSEICPGACHFSSRLHRYRLICKLTDALRRKGSPVFSVTAVKDLWECSPGHLKSCKPEKLHVWFKRRLARLHLPRGSTIGVMGVEASLNIDGNRTIWAPHIHAVITGAGHKELRAAFSGNIYTTRQSIMMKEVRPDDIGSVVGYAIKRLPVARTAYKGSNGRQQQRKTKLPPDFLTEYDAWLMSQTVNQRMQLIGLHSRYV